MQTHVSPRELQNVLHQVASPSSNSSNVADHDRPIYGVRFDADIIETFASKLYFRAGLMVLWYGFLGFLVGCVAVGPLYYFAPATFIHEFKVLVVSAPPALFLLLGIVRGNSKAFDLRLRAQLALCQLQIERNTRAAFRG